MGKTNFFDFKDSLSSGRSRQPPRAPSPGANGNGTPKGSGPGTPNGSPQGGRTAAPNAKTATPPVPQALTVSQLTHAIDGALKATLPPSVLVKGEVSNFK